jgi:hypothetical protein
MPIGKQEIEKGEVKRMLNQGIIEPSRSPWASNIVLVIKKDGRPRFCVDYRMLNDVTKKDAYPLPRVDECLDALAGAKWFGSMDLNAGFWQIGMAPEDKEKTAFWTSFGLYQFTVMPFGLVNSPSGFERLTEDVLRGLQWKELLLYMDDIISVCSTFEEWLCRLERIFIRLKEANLKLKPTKCYFFQKHIRFLGHIVSEDGISTEPDKINAVKEWPTDIISSMYRSSSFHWRPRRTSSISRSKLEGELTRPNGMTVYWYKSKLVKNAVFSLSSGAIPICKNPAFKSIEPNHFAPASASKHSSTLGKG